MCFRSAVVVCIFATWSFRNQHHIHRISRTSHQVLHWSTHHSNQIFFRNRFGTNLCYLELPCDLITVDVLNELAQVSHQNLLKSITMIINVMLIVTILHPTYNNSIRDAQIWPTFFSTSPTELSLPTFRVLAPSQPRLGYHKQGESIYFQILFFKKQIWQFPWYFPHSQVPLLLPQWDDLSRQLHEEDFQLH